MSNQGHWTAGDPATPDKLNSSLVQKGALASFDDAFTGMVVIDTGDGNRWKRALGDGLGFEAVMSPVPSSDAVLSATTSAAVGGTTVTRLRDGALTTTYGLTKTITRTPSNARKLHSIFAFGIAGATTINATQGTIFTRILVDDVEQVEASLPFGGTAEEFLVTVTATHTETELSAASHTFKAQFKRSAEWSADLMAGAISVAEAAGA